MAIFLRSKIIFKFNFISIRRTFCCLQNAEHHEIANILSNKPSDTVKNVKGWIKGVRKMKNYCFISVNDGSSPQHLQIVIPRDLVPKGLANGASISATGKIELNPYGNLELQCQSIQVVGTCDVTDNFPLVPKQKHSFDYCRQYLDFRFKTSVFCSIFRARNETSFAIHQFFREAGFINVHTPLITSNDCEGAGETFKIKPSKKELIQDDKVHGKDQNFFFGKEAYLTVSGQLHLEVATRSLPKVYSFGPVFRADNSRSRFHLSEFYMVEAEEGFLTDMKTLLKTMEDLIKFVMSNIISKCADDIIVIDKYQNNTSSLNSLEKLIKRPFAIMTYQEAFSTIQDHMGSTTSSYEDGFTKDEEIFLVKHNDDIPIFIVDWPKSMKPFYMKSATENSELVSAVDLLVPNVGELCGGGLREDNYLLLKEKLVEAKQLEAFAWYLDLRKYGNVPSGGFGMGFERLLQMMLNIPNVKDVIPFPRWPHVLLI